ncbi:hypothetical protein NW762_005268 [Fusarium torreyae]|uniref:Transmembrane protein n=1 Tax=Fusarium torreyae TaxID=1237075 RepID=A0A9W8VIX7_9HYPO|nr:hypothetical protein NW762_005268 [Fusarium torreyae]
MASPTLSDPLINPNETIWSTHHPSTLAGHFEQFYAGLDEEMTVRFWWEVGLVACMVFVFSVVVVLVFQYAVQRTKERCWWLCGGTEDDTGNGGHNGHPESYPMSELPTGPRPSGYTTHPTMGYMSSNPLAAYEPTLSPSGDSFDLSTADYESGRRPERYTTRPRSSGNNFGLSVPAYMSGALPPSDTGKDCSSVDGWTSL